MPATLIDVADSYIVLRPLTGNGVELERGEVVNCAGWRNLQPLINVRRLAPAPHDIESRVEKCECDRRWDGPTSLAEHVRHCAVRLERIAAEDNAAEEAEAKRRRGGRPPKAVEPQPVEEI